MQQTPGHLRITRPEGRYYELPFERDTVACSRWLQPPLHTHCKRHDRCRKKLLKANLRPRYSAEYRIYDSMKSRKLELADTGRIQCGQRPVIYE